MSSPDLLASVVRVRPQLSDGFLAHAAHEAMTVYLEDWELAAGRLERQIDVLRDARDERKAAKERGDWPSSGG